MVLRVLLYLKGISTYGITYKGVGDKGLHVFGDADFIRDPHDRCSTSGGAIMCGCAEASWFSRAQTCVAISTEVEYVALSDAVKEADSFVGILKFLEPQRERGIIVHEDSQGVIRQVTNPPYLSPVSSH